MSGKENPNMSLVRVGATRTEMLLLFGPPVNVATLADGKRTETYKYEIGNEPSTGRAVFHGAMDVFTLGLWEVVGTPIEGIQGEEHMIQLTFDKNDKVTDILSVQAPKQEPVSTTYE